MTCIHGTTNRKALKSLGTQAEPNSVVLSLIFVAPPFVKIPFHNYSIGHLKFLQFESVDLKFDGLDNGCVMAPSLPKHQDSERTISMVITPSFHHRILQLKSAGKAQFVVANSEPILIQQAPRSSKNERLNPFSNNRQLEDRILPQEGTWAGNLNLH